ncbi:MAG TPA: cobalamin biosynthesis bifunctional protein CbiET, partial [Allocoleopsis sp.]
MLTPIHVVGIGLDGAIGLAPPILELIEQATLLVGSDRHLSYFPHFQGERLILGDLRQTIEQIHRTLDQTLDQTLAHSSSSVVS